MLIISFCYNYKLNDLLKETCTYSGIMLAVQVSNRGQTGFPARHIYDDQDDVGFAKFTELERNEHLIFQKIFNLFSFLSVGKLSLS